MAETKQITRNQLAELLGGLRGASILSLSWQGSDPARFKHDRGRITKVSHYSGMVNAHYDRKKAKEMGISTDDVEIAPCNWLEPAPEGGCVTQHNGGKDGKSPKRGTRYVTFYPQSGATEYTLDGTPCKRDDVAELVKANSRGVVPNFRRIKLENITGAVINKTHYQVIE